MGNATSESVASTIAKTIAGSSAPNNNQNREVARLNRRVEKLEATQKRDGNANHGLYPVQPSLEPNRPANVVPNVNPMYPVQQIPALNYAPPPAPYGYMGGPVRSVPVAYQQQTMVPPPMVPPPMVPPPMVPPPMIPPQGPPPPAYNQQWSQPPYNQRNNDANCHPYTQPPRFSYGSGGNRGRGSFRGNYNWRNRGNTHRFQGPSSNKQTVSPPNDTKPNQNHTAKDKEKKEQRALFLDTPCDNNKKVEDYLNKLAAKPVAAKKNLTLTELKDLFSSANHDESSHDSTEKNHNSLDDFVVLESADDLTDNGSEHSFTTACEKLSLTDKKQVDKAKNKGKGPTPSTVLSKSNPGRKAFLFKFVVDGIPTMDGALAMGIPAKQFARRVEGFILESSAEDVKKTPKTVADILAFKQTYPDGKLKFDSSKLS